MALTVFLLVSGMAVFGSATPVTRIIGQDFPVMLAAEIRVLIGTLALLPLASPHFRDLGKISRTDWGRIGVIALFGMFGFSVLMLYGMRLIPGAAGAVVMSTGPQLPPSAPLSFLASG